MKEWLKDWLESEPSPWSNYSHELLKSFVHRYLDGDFSPLRTFNISRREYSHEDAMRYLQAGGCRVTVGIPTSDSEVHESELFSSSPRPLHIVHDWKEWLEDQMDGSMLTLDQKLVGLGAVAYRHKPTEKLVDALNLEFSIRINQEPYLRPDRSNADSFTMLWLLGCGVPVRKYEYRYCYIEDPDNMADISVWAPAVEKMLPGIRDGLIKRRARQERAKELGTEKVKEFRAAYHEFQEHVSRRNQVLFRGTDVDLDSALPLGSADAAVAWADACDAQIETLRQEIAQQEARKAVYLDIAERMRAMGAETDNRHKVLARRQLVELLEAEAPVIMVDSESNPGWLVEMARTWVKHGKKRLLGEILKKEKEE